MRVLFFSDAHLDERIWATEPEICGDAFWALEQVRRFAREYKVDAVICGGDLLDSVQPSTRTVLVLRQFLEDLASQNILFAFIQGQHDHADPAWAEALSKDAINLHGRLTDIGGIWFQGINWRPRTLLMHEAEKLDPRVQVVVVHQLWSELLGAKAGSLADASLRELFGDFRHLSLVYSGDMHSVAFLDAGFQAISTGATHFCRIGEPTDNHLCVIVDFESDEIESLPFKNRHIERWFIRSPADLRLLFSDKTTERLRMSFAAMEASGAPPSVCKPLLLIEIDESQAAQFDERRGLLCDVAFVRSVVKHAQSSQDEPTAYDSHRSMEDFVRRLDGILCTDYGLADEDAKDLERIVGACCIQGYDAAEEELSAVRARRLRGDRILDGEKT